MTQKKKKPPAKLVSFSSHPHPPQVPLKKNAELCNFIRNEQRGKKSEWRTERGGVLRVCGRAESGDGGEHGG